MLVPFYGRSRGGAENRYVRDCLSSGLETDGFFMNLLVKNWEMQFPGTQPLFTTSCTSALETAIACLGLKEGDEVILPSFNFPSAANAVLLHGGTPVLCDIDGDTQNISVKDMLGRIGPRTRAVVAVHYAGVSCPMEGLMEAAGISGKTAAEPGKASGDEPGKVAAKEPGRVSAEAGIALIEDAAQGIGAGYIDRRGNRRPLGTIGDFGAVSFHHTKNLTCGEGGALLAAGPEYYRWAGQYRLHGTNRAMYLKGEVDRYTWNLPGSCTAMAELQAAVLASQLELLEEVTAWRNGVCGVYRERLGELEKRGNARLMRIPDYASPNGHIFYLRFETEKQRDQVMAFLRSREIESKTHYVPLHMSPQGRRLGYRETDLEESVKCYRTLLRLPVHGRMSREQVEFVAESVLEACR